MEDPAKYQIRTAQKDDTDWIVARHAALYRDSDGFDASFEVFVRRVVDAYFADENPDRERGWIAERRGHPIGSIFCDATDDADTARLRLFFLETHARGMGLGGKLLDECLGFAKRVGYKRMVLWTHESHVSACALYEKRGFKKGKTQTTRSFGAEMVEVDYALQLTQ